MILAIDLGSTNFKAALYNDKLNMVGEYALPSPYICNDGNCVEMDVEAVQRTIVQLIKSTCKDAGVETSSIVSVAVGSQAQNFTIIDSQGNARCPIISWLDQRSGTEAQELWKMLGEDWHNHCSFPKIDASMQLSHLLRLKNTMPEIMDGEFSIVTLPGLVFRLLADVNITDENQAAMSGTYSLLEKEWRLDILKQCGVTVDNLPKCFPVGTSVTVESNCKELDLRKEISLVVAGNDQTAGAFGNGCQESDIIATLGTALVAYRRTGDQLGPFSPNGCWGPYPGRGYYELAFTNNGCQALDWGREVIMPGHDINKFNEAVALVIPMITESTGNFYPSAIRTDKAWQGDFANDEEKAYAILEGITFDLYKLIFDDLAAPSGISLRVIGGGSHSKLWLQLIADTLNCPVSAGAGDSLLGAAAMAAGKDVVPIQSKVFRPSARHQLLDIRRKAALGRK